MATRQFMWRTAPSGTEGTTTVYVDSNFGSDIYGNGTRANPYKTLTKAWSPSTKPSSIICRGTFTERMSQGNHACSINGDYMGAATFDGDGVYMLYGYGHSKMIIRNVPVASGEDPVSGGSAFMAGVGRANNALSVGYANYVNGVAGSSVSLHKSSLYFGYIGGNTAVKGCLYDTPKCNTTYLLSLGGLQNAMFLSNCTVYNVAVENRVKCSYGNTCQTTLFGKFAFIGNEGRKIDFIGCVFASDCKWYWFTGNKGTDGYEEITLTGTTSEERQASLLAALIEKGLASNLRPTFTNCIFSSQSSEQIFNDADNEDFTLVPGCDADWPENLYCGAFPPAKRVPVMTDSAGVPETWDERSVSGCLSVADNAIVLDTESASLIGDIQSKIIQINPSVTQFNYIQDAFESKFRGLRSYLNSEVCTGTVYEAGETLPQGRYLVYGTSVVYNGTTIRDGHAVLVTADDTTFTANDNAKLVEVVEPNIMDVVYVRCRQAVYARVSTSDTLQKGATYLNDGVNDIVYHGRTIVPGESFGCLVSGEQFTCPDDPTQQIAVMFDDTRVPASEWIPAQMFGEYFVSMIGGVVEEDQYGIPYSSGNYLSYQGKALIKNILDKQYIQFAIKLTRYGTGIVN